MPDEKKWFDDSEALLDTAKRSGWPAGPLPRIEGYDEFEELQRGGQGVVYRAVQISTKRPVAIKVLREGAFATEAQRRRFDREIELVAALRHPNIVRVYDSGVTSDGRPFLVMEYVKGCALDEHLAAPAAAIRETLQLFVTTCEAVQYAHLRGVMHRDLKPSNIRVDQFDLDQTARRNQGAP